MKFVPIEEAYPLANVTPDYYYKSGEFDHIYRQYPQVSECKRFMTHLHSCPMCQKRLEKYIQEKLQSTVAMRQNQNQNHSPQPQKKNEQQEQRPTTILRSFQRNKLNISLMVITTIVWVCIFCYFVLKN